MSKYLIGCLFCLLCLSGCDNQANMTKLSKNVKIVIFVPQDYAFTILQAIGEAGAGRIETYDYCSFSTNGIARFRPKEGSTPNIGKIDEISSVQEVRIEAICDKKIICEVIQAAKKVHPYEAMGYDIYPLLECIQIFDCIQIK